MAPGKVGEEFFLTRGHIHARGDRPEIYYGQAGRGLMQLEVPEGEVRLLEIGPQSICYVPPFWIHRSINTGDEDLVMMFATRPIPARTTPSSSGRAACARASSTTADGWRGPKPRLAPALGRRDRRSSPLGEPA